MLNYKDNIRSEQDWLEVLIPSVDVRTNLLNLNHKFSDADKATLVYNSDYGINKIHALLQEIAATTKDDILRNQIIERIEYDCKQIEGFKSITSEESSYIYQVIVDDGEFGEHVFGYTQDYSKAHELGCITDSDFSINKIEVITSKDNLEYYKQYNCTGFPDTITYSKDGEILSFNIKDLTLNDSKFCLQNRFEDRYVDIPNPFEVGDLLKSIDGGEIGVCSYDKSFLESMPNVKRDICDIVITLDYLHEDPYTRRIKFSHEHIDVRYLEKVNEEELKKTMDLSTVEGKKLAVLLSASEMRKGKRSLEYFMIQFQDHFR